MKNYFLIVDTETTKTDKVVDFGAVVVDTDGNILASCAVLISELYKVDPLFYDSKSEIFSLATMQPRYAKYDEMLANGTRRMATVAAVNRWLVNVKAKFNPILTAYNLPFDLGKCSNTAIDLSIFNRSFCLWAAAYTAFAFTKQYRAFVLSIHAFNAPTKLGNMTFKTNAETMTRFVLGMPTLEDEPHTALEDAVYYELPILKALLSKHSAKWLLTKTNSYSWNSVQVRDWFKA